MVELWITLLLYGGGAMDGLQLLERRGLRRIFGWLRVPDPTTFGRWLRRAGGQLVPLLDKLTWRLVRSRWAEVGTPRELTLLLDSTVSVRYGEKQGGRERLQQQEAGPSLASSPARLRGRYRRLSGRAMARW